MQESLQIGWDPMSVDYHMPWASKLLILYLLVVVTAALVKSVSMLRILWFSRRGPLRLPRTEHEFMLAWEKCSNKVQSMKRLVFVTLLWTILIAVFLLRSDVQIFAEQKVFGPGAFFGTAAADLTVLALGLLVCAVLYTACAFYEGALLRRRESWNGTLANFEGQQSKG